MGIAGDWYNEFGSHMRLTVDPAGHISGTYTSGTSHVVGRYPIVGLCHPPGEEGHGRVLGWTVVWSNQQTDVGSATSWSGQYFEHEDRIRATWLLTRSASAADAWEATVVGQDVFARDLPTAATA